MTQPRYRDVSMFNYLGGVEATLRNKVFCSSNWHRVCCREAKTSAGAVMRIDMHAYPPGGEQTAMCRCLECGRWAPREVAADCCVDCAIEVADAAFRKRMRQLFRQTRDRVLVRTIECRHWSRPIIRSEKEKSDQSPTPKRPVRRKRKEDEDESPVYATDFVMGGMRERIRASLPAVDALTFAEQRTTGGQHWLAEALDMPEQPRMRQSYAAVIQTIQTHLEWVRHDGNRRAVGCSIVVLPEDERSLRDEMAEYAATGKIRRAVRPGGRGERYRRFRRKRTSRPEMAA